MADGQLTITLISDIRKLQNDFARMGKENDKLRDSLGRVRKELAGIKKGQQGTLSDAAKFATSMIASYLSIQKAIQAVTATHAEMQRNIKASKAPTETIASGQRKLAVALADRDITNEQRRSVVDQLTGKDMIRATKIGAGQLGAVAADIFSAKSGRSLDLVPMVAQIIKTLGPIHQDDPEELSAVAGMVADMSKSVGQAFYVGKTQEQAILELAGLAYSIKRQSRGVSMQEVKEAAPIATVWANLFEGNDQENTRLAGVFFSWFTDMLGRGSHEQVRTGLQNLQATMMDDPYLNSQLEKAGKEKSVANYIWALRRSKINLTEEEQMSTDQMRELLNVYSKRTRGEWERDESGFAAWQAEFAAHVKGRSGTKKMLALLADPNAPMWDIFDEINSLVDYHGNVAGGLRDFNLGGTNVIAADSAMRQTKALSDYYRANTHAPQEAVRQMLFDQETGVMRRTADTPGQIARSYYERAQFSLDEYLQGDMAENPEKYAAFAERTAENWLNQLAVGGSESDKAEALATLKDIRTLLGDIRDGTYKPSKPGTNRE